MGRSKQTATKPGPAKKPKPMSQRAAVSLEIKKQQGLLKSVSITAAAPETNSPTFDRPCCCPCCDYKITMAEIYAGFSQDDPLEVRTTCPSCAGRFMATLMVNGGAFVVALGPAQVVDQYHELVEQGVLTWAEFEDTMFTRAPYIAWNAYWHSLEHQQPNEIIVTKVFRGLFPQVSLSNL